MNSEGLKKLRDEMLKDGRLFRYVRISPKFLKKLRKTAKLTRMRG